MKVGPRPILFASAPFVSGRRLLSAQVARIPLPGYDGATRAALAALAVGSTALGPRR